MAESKPAELSQEFHSRLSALEQTAAQLNKASNSINSTINTVENVVGAMNVGVEVWLRPPLTQTDAVGSTGGETVWTEHRLGYARVDGKWRLAVKSFRLHSGFYQGDQDCPYQNVYVEDDSLIPLTQASREARIASLGLLSDLLAELDSAAKASLEKIEKATSLIP